MKGIRDLARTVGGIVTSPRMTLDGLASDAYALAKGVAVLSVVSAVYVAILLAFIGRGYPAAAPSILPIAADEQYAIQVWYQVPLFFGATAVTAGVLVLLSRAAGRPAPGGLAFARVSLATAVPFGLTTMIVESVLAIVLLLGAVAPRDALDWLTGRGAWFATLYQVVGLAWLVALLALSVSVTTRWGASRCLLGTAMLALVYGAPVALLIR